ncbi:FAD-dependent oxidoreductase [Ihubacter massiliensis]|uniref:FAD-dependent oxidoreductase n=1 Tax=Hominibacterium faecale TaxID=2839743 RepID=A0A9J6QUF8_9FIRM|nr:MULTISPECIES: FAD-dependent oxidoreductase [Eubacteriales Family XIII. Incertae Sedis]MCI7300202.1 FAD-dependent oxidoreductase [Clostridia bacterium]MCO7121461.1 FAD-dependent oxidoreductase [Ihubacter massiliensis]MCU7378447.1 FAD-dependent oxidoreductase [Hominibacterium faecale]MDY3010263.1 FAD-dependent oxidoreductase [Clostridiales Family XIII bacterium]
MKKYDAIIIGFGKGGKTLAGDLAGQGKRVALIEKSRNMYGGTCINVGCIPTKSLVHSAELAEAFHFDSFEKKAEFYRASMEEKQRLVEMLRQKNYDKVNASENADIYDGLGSFVSDHEVKVKSQEGEEILYGEQIFINTGSEAFVPPIPGLAQAERAYTSQTLLDLKELPRHLVILGGGYIGLEFASFYASFGSKVTVIQMEDLFIGREDREIADVVKAALEKKGITFIMSAATKEITGDSDMVKVEYEAGGRAAFVQGDALLVATGRRPNTKDLQLDQAGVETLKNGAVKTDENRRSSKSHIFAMGDVAGGLQFTYVSLDDYRVVKSALSGGSYTAENRNIPYSVFIDPPLSRVGLTADEAKEKGYQNVKSVSLPAPAIPKAQVLQQPTGLLKAVIDGDTEQILGATLFCSESHEMINQIKLAMDLGASYKVLANQIFTHPTMSESLNDLFSAVK